MKSKVRSTEYGERRKNKLAQFVAVLLTTYSLLSFFPLPFLHAEESKISVRAQVDKAFLTIGDPVVYTVTVKHHKDLKIVSEIQPPSDPSLQIKKVEEIDTKEADFLYTGKRVTFTAYSLGEYVLEPVSVKYLDTDGQTKTLQTDKIYLSVKSVAEGEEKTDIRGVKGVLKLAAKWLVGLGIFGLLAGLVVGLLIFLKMRKKAAENSEPELIRSSEDEAMFQLNQLFDSDLLRRGKIKEYYLRLSEILREYFERRFSIPAVEATTYEISRQLKQKEVEAPLRDLIQEVLEAADLAKFAKWHPEPAEILQINNKSKQIIETAKPKEVRDGV